VRFFLIDLKKYRILGSAFCLALSLVIVFSIVMAGANFYYSSDEYVEALIEESDKKLVIIDAGHGGEDCGAVGVTGVYEKDLNYDISFQLGKLFTDAGYAVVYTRTSDKLLYTEAENIKGIRKISDLKNRCKIAAEYPNALFISIHMNSYSNPKYSGLQVYYSTENEDSKVLASAIQRNVKERLQADNNRKIKSGEGIYILENVENTAVLVECGFLTNHEECKKLSEKEYQKSLSFSIFCGIIEYIESN